MKLKGYYHLSVKGPHPDGGTIIHHPRVGEIRVSQYHYIPQSDEWDVLEWIEAPPKEER